MQSQAQSTVSPPTTEESTSADRFPLSGEGESTLESASLFGFAAPAFSFDEILCEAIVREYAQGYVACFLDRHRGRLDRLSRGLPRLLDEALDRDLTFRAAWDPAFAAIRRAALLGEACSDLVVSHSAAAAGLRLLAAGHAAGFESSLDPSTPLRLDRWMIPRGDRLVASGDGRRIELVLIEGANRTRVVLEKNSRNWSATGAVAIPSFRIAGTTAVILESPPDQEQPRTRQTPRSVLATTRAAVAILRRHAPMYVPWVDRVLLGIVPWEGSHSNLRSGSDFDEPGVIQISYPAPPAAVAEMLVHECSHLTFQILTRLGDVDDGTDSTLYYSPVKQTGRPISRILLAYHAFANVLLFYRFCLGSGIDDDGYCERNERATIPQLEQLEEALERTNALTQFGRALYEPLRELIR